MSSGLYVSSRIEVVLVDFAYKKSQIKHVEQNPGFSGGNGKTCRVLKRQGMTPTSPDENVNYGQLN